MLQDTQDFANSGPLPLAPADLDELARWVPKKEMALLIDLCERAWRDPDLARPALLLCWAYRKSRACWIRIPFRRSPARSPPGFRSFARAAGCEC